MSNKKQGKFNIVLIMIGALCMGIGLFGLVPTLMEYYSASKSYDELETTYVTVYENNIGETAGARVWYELAAVDVTSLKQKYPNTIGWLFFENEDISYPIMQTSDNAYYLNKSYDGTRSSSGSIFMDTYSDPDFSDFHSIIYGHNMKDLSMFGRLKYYKTQGNYYDTHQFFQIFTEDEILRYQIFSCQECPVTSVIFEMENPASASDILKEMMNNSMVSSGISVSAQDKVITLSTCTSSDEYRFLVSAVLVDRHSLEENE